jgi:hypothetical protein
MTDIKNMKVFKLEFTQELKGYYMGKTEIKAETRKEALDKLGKLSNTELDDLVKWSPGNAYYGDPDTTTLIKIEEL